MYHLPLLPGYGPNANVRSSAPSKAKTGKTFQAHLSEAEENGYQGQYFTSMGSQPSSPRMQGYISSNSPVQTRKLKFADSPSTVVAPQRAQTYEESDVEPGFATEPETIYTDSQTDRPGSPVEPDPGAETDPGIYGRSPSAQKAVEPEAEAEDSYKKSEEEVAEVVFFEYGVAVFFGMEEHHERDIIEDIVNAGIMRRKLEEDDWEIEECHYTVRGFGCSNRFQLTLS